MNAQILSDKFSEPLDSATTARFDIHAGDGNLTIDPLAGGEQILAGGTLQYIENQGVPTRILDSKNGKTTLTLRGSTAGRPWFHFPWSACNGATEWQIHLNPTVPSDITAHSDGGNVKLNLAGMSVTHVSADTGGGNLDMVLPDNTDNLGVIARTGAGNVTVEIGGGIVGKNIVNAESGAGNVDVYIPSDVAARIHATTGLGKAMVDLRFSKIKDNTYQSSDFDTAANKVEITLHSGAGNVSVNTR